MSELTDEIKIQVINSIQESAHGSTPVNIKDLDKFMLEAVKHLGKSGEGVGISQTSGGGASITLIITGLKVSVDIMHKIARRYFTRQLRYLDEQIIPSSHYEGDNATATGQTRGRMRVQSITDNMELRDNFFRFKMPDAIRKGDVEKRQSLAKKNNWKEKYGVLRTTKKGKTYMRKGQSFADPTKIQKGKRKGQPYEPKTYNQVAGYIEQRFGKPIFFSGEQEIKEMIVTELIEAMR